MRKIAHRVAVGIVAVTTLGLGIGGVASATDSGTLGLQATRAEVNNGAVTVFGSAACAQAVRNYFGSMIPNHLQVGFGGLSWTATQGENAASFTLSARMNPCYNNDPKVRKVCGTSNSPCVWSTGDFSLPYSSPYVGSGFVAGTVMVNVQSATDVNGVVFINNEPVIVGEDANGGPIYLTLPIGTNVTWSGSVKATVLRGGGR